MDAPHRWLRDTQAVGTLDAVNARCLDFKELACSEPRFIPEATSQRHPAACYAQPTLALHRIRKAPGICRPWDVRVSSGRDREVGDVRACDFLKRRRSPCPAPHGCAYCLCAWIGAVDPDTRPSSIARPPSPFRPSHLTNSQPLLCKFVKFAHLTNCLSRGLRPESALG